jgi:hypothetical protein
MAVVYHNTHLAKGPRAFWRAYFDCLSMDDRDGIATTDEERQRFVRMWERGTVVWRDDGGLLASSGRRLETIADAVLPR